MKRQPKFPNCIGIIRARQEMTLEEISFKVPCSRAAVWNWENGDSEPTLSKARLVACALGVSVDEVWPPDGQVVTAADFSDIVGEVRDYGMPWHGRGRFLGYAVEREATPREDGSYAVRITNLDGDDVGFAELQPLFDH